ncbi:hypothetical protein ACWCP6_26730 [Streptomyces sp. NPDC002004]
MGIFDKLKHQTEDKARKGSEPLGTDAGAPSPTHKAGRARERLLEERRIHTTDPKAAEDASYDPDATDDEGIGGYHGRGHQPL